MSSQFIYSFLTMINGKVPDEALPTIRSELITLCNNYNIEQKSTELALYKGYLPECFKVYMVTRKIEGLSDGSLENYRLRLEDFFREVNKPIEDIKANDIRLYLYQYQERRGVTNRTLDGIRTVINTFLEWACNEEYIPKNPCRNIKPIKYEEKMREPLSDVELEMVRNACHTLKEKAIIEVLYSTGCRVSELVSLNRTDVLAGDQTDIVGKGKKHRDIYFNAKSMITAKEYIISRCDYNEALFVSDRKPYQRLTVSAIEKIVRIIGERSGIGRRLHPHLLRHTTATDGLQRGMPVENVQKMLGHADISTTMIYAHTSQADVKKDHKKYIV